MKLPHLGWGLRSGARRWLRGVRLLPPEPPPTLDLSGDRSVEWTYVVAHMPAGPGRVLDFGPAGSDLGLVAARRGFEVVAVDLQPVAPTVEFGGMTTLAGDLADVALAPASFDLILNCSTIEHVGLAGRYGVTRARRDGDLAAMAKLRGLLKPEGRMLLTLPVGRDHVFAPLHRIYGSQRLPRLLDGFRVLDEEYWLKNEANRWRRASRAEALDAPAQERLYGLACMTLVPVPPR